MLRSFALWLLDFIYLKLDEDVAAQVDAVHAKKKAADDAVAAAQVELDGLLRERGSLGQEAASVKLSNETTLATIEMARAERQKLADTEAELARDRDAIRERSTALRAEIAQMSDHDVLRQSL